jgi:hypothetical protein
MKLIVTEVLTVGSFDMSHTSIECNVASALLTKRTPTLCVLRRSSPSMPKASGGAPVSNRTYGRFAVARQRFSNSRLISRREASRIFPGF